MDYPEPPGRVPPWLRALDVVPHQVDHRPEAGLALTVTFGGLPRGRIARPWTTAIRACTW